MEKSHILKAGVWYSPEKTETIKQTESNRGTIWLYIDLERACFIVAFLITLSLSSRLTHCVSHPLSFPLSPYRDIYTGDRREREREQDFGRLPISSSPWRPWDQASKGSTHTHTLLAATEENSLALCYIENPHFPSIRQTGRQLGVTLNPFPHVSPLTRAPLLLSLLSVCCSLYLMPHAWKGEKRVSFGKYITMIWLQKEE